METNTLLQRKEVFHTANSIIRATFPFQSKNELKKFQFSHKSFLRTLHSIGNDHEFFLLLEQFLASLHDSHTKLTSYPTKRFFSPNFCRVEHADRAFYLFYKNRFSGKIVSVDGKLTETIVEEQKKRIASSSKQEFLARVKDWILLSDNETPAIIIVQSKKGKKKTLILPRIPTQKLKKKESDPVSAIILKGRIGYLAVKSWALEHSETIKKKTDEAFEKFAKRHVRTVILDVRENYGGNAALARYVAGRLFEKPVVFGKPKTRMAKRRLTFRKNTLTVEPRSLFVPLPIILLIGPRCISTSEYFIAGLKDNKRAILAGQPTGGSSGNPNMFEIPYRDSKLKISVSTWRYYRKNRKPLEGKGITPDYLITPTLNDMKKGRDRALETALRIGKKTRLYQPSKLKK